MKKMPAPVTEPAKISGVDIYYKTNTTPKLYKKQINKFKNYENLIDEFIAANPNYSEYELDRACLYFATQCGLTVAEKAKQKIGGSHVY